jgi:hypothetical protein
VERRTGKARTPFNVVSTSADDAARRRRAHWLENGRTGKAGTASNVVAASGDDAAAEFVQARRICSELRTGVSVRFFAIR